MTRTELPQLIDEVASLWPALRLTTEGNVVFVGFRRRNGTFAPGMFSSCDLRIAIETCRQWAAEHPGSLPTWNDGRGWQEIKYAVRQTIEAAQPTREERLLQEHRDHYRDSGEPWSGDDIILEHIRTGSPTPLQAKSLSRIGRLRQHLRDLYPDVDFDAATKRRQQAQREAVRDMVIHDSRRDKPEPVKLRPPCENVTPGHKMPWSNGFEMTPEQIAACFAEAEKKVKAHTGAAR
ncbi:MAG: hypothetical protein JW741_12000 [Sedimentisphaerales bacterium]|nr:hypothetical protein [Sedimentisphaerales bacterium]